MYYLFWLQEIKSRRNIILTQLQELQDAVDPVLRLMRRDDVMKTMETMRDSKMLINYLTTNKEFEVTTNTAVLPFNWDFFPKQVPYLLYKLFYRFHK